MLIWWPVQRLIPLLLHQYAHSVLPRTTPVVRQPLETRPEQTPSSPPPLPVLRPSTSRAVRCSSQQSTDEIQACIAWSETCIVVDLSEAEVQEGGGELCAAQSEPGRDPHLSPTTLSSL